MENLNNADFFESKQPDEPVPKKAIIRPEKTSVLQLIQDGTLTIAASNPQNRISSETTTFKDIEKTYYAWNLNNPQPAQPACQVLIYRLIKNASLFEAFESLKIDIRDLCLTQSQIVSLCKKQWLCFNSESHPTFFLFEENGQPYVLATYFKIRNYKLAAQIAYHGEFYKFNDTKVWFAGTQCQFVVKN